MDSHPCLSQTDGPVERLRTIVQVLETVMVNSFAADRYQRSESKGSRSDGALPILASLAEEQDNTTASHPILKEVKLWFGACS
jgi:hypothetical protein